MLIVVSGKKYSHLRDRDRMMAILLPRSCEDGNICHGTQLVKIERTVPILGVICLKTTALRERDRSFPHQLDGGFLPTCLSIASETPCHQIPRNTLPGEIPRGYSRRIHAVRWRIISRQEIHRSRHRLGHVMGVCPVAADLEVRILAPDSGDIVSEIVTERFPMELLPLVPAWILRR